MSGPRSLTAAMILVLIMAVIFCVNALSEKVDASSVQGIPETEVKCTPCEEQHPVPLPPPPPPPACPQPPPPPPPSPPKTPSTQNSPPPPPPPFYYITTSQPGNLYPFDQDYDGAATGNRPPGVLIAVGFWLFIGLFGYMEL